MKTIKKDPGLLKKNSLLGAAFIVVLGVSGCSNNSTPAPVADETFTPFERIATLDVVTDAAGAVDYVATYAKTQAVADVIHDYFIATDETTFTHDDGTNYPANWIIAGQDSPAFLGGITQIPSTDLIDPAVAASPANTYKVKVMDICNSYYAAKALGKTDIVTGQKVADGFIHAPALPCEVSVYNDGVNIYVDMLNPDAIFTLFFSDTVFGAQMDDAAFATEISQLPGTVKTELKTIIYAALDEAVVADASFAYTALAEKIGPEYTQDEILTVVDESPYDSPYIHFSYMKPDASEFTAAEVKGVASAIIQTMSIHGLTTTDGRINGEHVPALESLLSPDSSWRSARSFPLGLPGVGVDDAAVAYNNFIIEACSPLYAKQAMGTGRHHAGALPCEISVTAIESTPGSTNYDTLVISFLEPGFMFTALFKDSFATMTEAELLTYSALPPAVLQDLQNIVDHSVANDLAVTVTYSGRLTYDMMPN
ncbi:MAG: hypothetical protein OEY06_12490 [Gammaproteobacteria bacterium]|nr:hypothetical protein [Gammaproteobacteria bacterium]